MKIRTATQDDMAALCRLLDEQNGFHAAIAPETFRRHPTDASRIALTFQDPAMTILVAEDGGRLLGLIELKVQQTKDLPILKQKTYVGIAEMIVAEAHRSRGVGAALMDAAKAWGRARGAASLRTSVVPKNDRARAFYRKHGFADTMISIEAQL